MNAKNTKLQDKIRDKRELLKEGNIKKKTLQNEIYQNQIDIDDDEIQLNGIKRENEVYKELLKNQIELTTQKENEIKSL